MIKTIVFVEDDDVIRENYTEFLEEAGFDVRPFADRQSAIESIAERMPHLAVLDVALGHERDGGFKLCADIRRRSEELPIVFLTSHDDEINKISALRLGADDYLSKDSSIELLIVRIETLLRRMEVLRIGSTDRDILVGELRVDSQTATIRWKEERVDLSLTQFWMVEALARDPGRARSHSELMSAASIVVEPNTIAAHMKTIRQRFRLIDPAFDAIRAERGLGYRWMSPA